MLDKTLEQISSIRKDYINKIIPNPSEKIKDNSLEFFAPSNIALVKYWGKRDDLLFLPESSSISLSLGDKGAKTKVKIIESSDHIIICNGNRVYNQSRFARPIIEFLSLFDGNLKKKYSFQVETKLNIKHSSGLASSACGFAALTLCLNDLFCWELSTRDLSLIARLGSGSACRSLFSGFVQWNKGEDSSGLDSYSEPLNVLWPELRWGILSESDLGIKVHSSRKAMQICRKTSPLYKYWPNIAKEHFIHMKQSLLKKDFSQIGQIMEQSCEVMHALIQSSSPSIFFRKNQSLSFIEKVLELRSQGIELYYTQDAGHHIKVLFLQRDEQIIKSFFGNIVEVIQPFGKDS